MNKRINGSAATTTVLLLGAIASLVATYMLLQSTDNAIVAKVLREGKKAEYASMSCAEVALEKLRLNTTYGGNETITISGTQNCSIGSIINTSGTYTIPVSAVYGDATKRHVITVTNIDTSVHIGSWEEVAN